MEERIFNNEHVIAWLQYFSSQTDIDLEHVKILDITRKNKNKFSTDLPLLEQHSGTEGRAYKKGAGFLPLLKNAVFMRLLA